MYSHYKNASGIVRFFLIYMIYPGLEITLKI